MTDFVRAIAVDIETYGIVRRLPSGGYAPDQTVFHPVRSRFSDGVHPKDQVVTVAVTIVNGPACTIAELNGSVLSQWTPGETMVFVMSNPVHRAMLQSWLRWANVLVGMNFQFDLLYLREQKDFRPVLDGRQFLVDLSVVNYLNSELRRERSLKNIGIVLGTHVYDEEESVKNGHRYRDSSDKNLHRYNGEDTHNTILDIAELARRTVAEYPNTDKLGEWCLRHYSDSIWHLCVRMGEAGLPMSRDMLARTEAELLAVSANARVKAEEKFGLILNGPGSNKSKNEFMSNCVKALCEIKPDARKIKFELTPKERKLSASDVNRELLEDNLPPDHPYQEALALFDEFSKAEKRVSSYTFPLLRHQRTWKIGKEKKVGSTILVLPSGEERAYPTWFAVPSATKDDAGPDGGTEQGRITCKGPAIQTFPSEIKKAVRPTRKGTVFKWIDLSQIELRVAALLSGDEGMVRAYVEGRDLHTDRAASFAGIDYLINKYGPNWMKAEGFKDLERQGGKHANFTDLNLGGPDVLQKTIRKKAGIIVSFDFCANIVARRALDRPGLVAWQERMLKLVLDQGYVCLPLSGISRSFHGTPETIREVYYPTIVNFPIQTTAGVLMREFQILIAKRLPPINAPKPFARQCVNIYDAAGLEIEERRLAETDQIIEDAFTELTTTGLWARLEDYYGRHVPIAYDSKVVA